VAAGLIGPSRNSAYPPMIRNMGRFIRGQFIPQKDREKGAALVEGAFITIFLVMLLVGTVTAALSYGRYTSLQTAAREATRFGATLPVSDMNTWLSAVLNVAKNAGGGDLAGSTAGQFICVAYVHPSAGKVNSLTQTGGVSGGVATTPCFADGRPNDEARVQVVAQRSTSIQAVLFTRNITLSASSAARFERG
jgi:Flp pilus assembly protein TadG